MPPSHRRRSSLLGSTRPDLQMSTFERVQGAHDAVADTPPSPAEQSVPPSAATRLPPPPLAPYVRPEERYFAGAQGPPQQWQRDDAYRPEAGAPDDARSAAGALSHNSRPPRSATFAALPSSASRAGSEASSSAQRRRLSAGAMREHDQMTASASSAASVAMSERAPSSNSRVSNGSKVSTRSGPSRASQDGTPSQAVSEPGPGTKRRTRVLMTRFQGQGLTRLWNQTKFPSAQDREQLANDIGLKPRQVQVWFQNQRQKFRRQMVQQQPSHPAAGATVAGGEDLGEGSSRWGGSSSSSSYLTTRSAQAPYHPSQLATTSAPPSAAASRFAPVNMPPRLRSYTDDAHRFPPRPPLLFPGGYAGQGPSQSPTYPTYQSAVDRYGYESPPRGALYGAHPGAAPQYPSEPLPPPPVQPTHSHSYPLPFERPPPLERPAALRSITYDSFSAPPRPAPSWPDPRAHQQHAHIPSYLRAPHSPPPTAPVLASAPVGSPRRRRRHASLEPDDASAGSGSGGGSGASAAPGRRPTHLPPSLSALVLDRPVHAARGALPALAVGALPAVELLSPPPSSRSFAFGGSASSPPSRAGLGSRAGLESRSSALSAATDARSLQTAGSDQTFMPPAAFRRHGGGGGGGHGDGAGEADVDVKLRDDDGVGEAHEGPLPGVDPDAARRPTLPSIHSLLD